MMDETELDGLMAVEEKWTIWVNGYGSFDFDGTEQEAEDRRAAKCRHEQGIGFKWRRENQRPSDILTDEIATAFDAGEGVPQGTFTKRKKALEKERAYEVYCHCHGEQEALITNGCRGGFGIGELVAFLYARSFPKEQWREKADWAFKNMGLSP